MLTGYYCTSSYIHLFSVNISYLFYYILKEYKFTDTFEATDKMVQDFSDYGYILVR